MQTKNLKILLFPALILFTIIGFKLLAFNPPAYKAGNPADQEIKVLIHTTKGDITVELYNETPKTRDNFVKLVNKKFYDSTLFHRVIQHFMIQGGDPDSKHAAPGKMLGNGDVGYMIPAEFHPDLFHKKGALACARNNNPEKASSGCQFYIVQGQVLTNEQLTNYENQQNMGLKQKIFTQLMDKPENAGLKQRFMAAQQSNNIDSIRYLAGMLEPQIDAIYANSPDKFAFSQAQREAYTTIGGTPQLDGEYTVFGEVVSGLNIVDSIAAVKTNQYDRPLVDVRILSMEVVN